MRVIIATPLYPPDIAATAVYIKELAKRLSRRHSITVITYGHLPEKIPGVSIITIDKRYPLFIRLPHFFFVLLGAVWHADILYVQNGASVELPAGLVALFTRIPLVIHTGDKMALKRAEQNDLLKYVAKFAKKRAREVISITPLQKPEILPFKPQPEEKFTEYEKSWKEHIRVLENIFQHV